MEKPFQVVIVGAGPTGLSAALLLARQKIPVLVVERRNRTSIHPRARGLNVRTMEIFRELGLEAEVQQAGAPLADNHLMLFVETLAGAEIRRVVDEEIVPVGEQLEALSPCDWSQCAQDELEPILLRAARKEGAEVVFGTELFSFVQDQDGVEVIVRDRATGEQRTLHTHYLLGADGAHSMVRQQLGLQVHGQETLEHFVNIYFRADLSDLVQDRHFGICFVQGIERDALFLSVNNTDRWLLNVSYQPEKGERVEDFDTLRCLELVRLAVGLPELQAEILSILPWEETARLVEQMSVGRVFLAGDAAHTMPPAGGFGLNTGVQDAHNLAWKLAVVLRHEADVALLHTYQIERHPIAQMVIEQAVREVRAPNPDDAQENPLQPILGYCYASHAILLGDNELPCVDSLKEPGRPGGRAPHVWLERHGERISTLDLFGFQFVLLAGSEGEVWNIAAQAVARELNLPLVTYRIDSSDLVDREQRWQVVYGVTPRGAVLVRPDGFICWRSHSQVAAPAQVLTQVLKQLLCQDSAV